VDIIQKDKDIQKGDRKKVIALIEVKVLPHFNFQAMTASAVGRNWEKANAEQKLRLTDEFKTLLVRTYASALASYSSQKFDFRPLRAKPADTDVTVGVDGELADRTDPLHDGADVMLLTPMEGG
jgi:phospholipid transport system substrate-binding protein